MKYESEKQMKNGRIHKSFDITLPSSRYNDNRDRMNNI